MSLFSRPKGTIVTTFPEWDVASMAFGGSPPEGGGGSPTDFSLFNDGTAPGESFLVYAILAQAFQDEQLTLYYGYGPGTNLVGPCFPLISGAPAPPGQIYKDSSAGAAPASAFNLPTIYISPIFAPNWPIAVIRPMYRLIVQENYGDSSAAVSFYYRHTII